MELLGKQLVKVFAQVVEPKSLSAVMWLYTNKHAPVYQPCKLVLEEEILTVLIIYLINPFWNGRIQNQ